MEGSCFMTFIFSQIILLGITGWIKNNYIFGAFNPALSDIQFSMLSYGWDESNRT